MRAILLFFLLAAAVATAQVTDNFNDGDFTTNPTWSGDGTEFIVNSSQQLQTNNTVSGASYLSTASPASSLNTTEWSFYVKQTFASSSSNYGRVYLASDQANLEGALNGYYLQFGESGSLDAVELFRQSGLTSTSVIRGTNAQIANSFALGVKVTRDASGNWSLYVDPSGGTAYTLEISGLDNTFTSTAFFGVATVYTSSNATKFYFDNFYNGPIIVDNTPPIILSSTVISNTQVDILFNEYISLSTAETATNYSVNNGLGYPSAALRDAGNFSLVHLTFATAFTSGLSNTLIVTNVQDLNGNAITAAASNFTYVAPTTVSYKDVIINEIFADPTPQIGLPAFEFVELYNRSSAIINLNGWKLTDGSSSAALNTYALLPNQYLIICPIADTASFTPFGNTMGVTSFPSLNNTGDNIYLKDNTLTTVDFVGYSDTWYRDAIKKGGGWTLELINPNANFYCGPSGNWTASHNPVGGTPGAQNSVYSTLNTDNMPPEVVRVNVIAADTIQVLFNEPLDSTTMINAATYSIDQGIGTPSQVHVIGPDYASVRLDLASPLQIGTIYTITINNTVTDCSGNGIGSDNTARFALPEPASANDIVINEILSDPKTGGVDFVEIYNRSNKVIDLKTLTLSQYDTVNNVMTSIENITTEGYLLFPQSYLVLSENATAVKSQYNTENLEGFLDMSNLPSMNIDGGTVCLASASAIIDNFKYYSDMHFGLLNSTKGISLERIDFNRPTQDRSNWHSAAATVGYATPAYKNSQYVDAGETEDALEITPEVFSPDEDGNNDVLNINFHFDTPGYAANITIYDSKGRIVKQLVRNELLGTKGTFRWDGLTDDREKARIGIYIIFFEVFDLRGNVKQYKKTCVLGGKL